MVMLLLLLAMAMVAMVVVMQRWHLYLLTSLTSVARCRKDLVEKYIRRTSVGHNSLKASSDNHSQNIL